MATAPYVGNPDFRGYLAYLADNGSQEAKNYLDIVGGDYAGATDVYTGDWAPAINYGTVSGIPITDAPTGINPQWLLEYAQGANTTVPQEYTNRTNIMNDIAKLYGEYTNFGNTGEVATGGLSSSDAAAYDTALQTLRGALGNLPNRQARGETDINTAYQNALDLLTQGKTRGQEDYTKATQGLGEQHVLDKNTIKTNAGMGLQGLQRLLGSRGAGGSSAAQMVAPGAVAQEAGSQLGSEGRLYGQNMQNLASPWARFLEDWERSKYDIGSQKMTQTNTLLDSIRGQGSDINNQIAQIEAAKSGNVANAQPYIDTANSLAAQVGVNPQVAPFQATSPAYTAPSAESYQAPRTTAAFQGGQTPANYSWLQTLLGKKKTNVA